MSDIVERLRADGAMKGYYAAPAIQREAADEIEKLRAENAKLAASNHAYLSNYQEAAAEIEKLRAALLFMVKALEGYGEIDEEDHLALTAARAALGEKE